MKITIVKNPAEVAQLAAKQIITTIQTKPTAKLILATGSSPIATYQLLVQAYCQKRLSFAQVATYNLDEYVGIAPNNPASYRFFMDEHLFNHVDIKRNNIHFPDGNGDLENNVTAFEQKLVAAAPIDLALLGIGNNGHIAFNEPGAPITSKTRIVNLTASTIAANQRFFKSAADVPKMAITMGISNILAADKIILIAHGSNKAQAVYDMVHKPMSSTCPASYLQSHKDVTVYVDELAGALLRQNEVTK